MVRFGMAGSRRKLAETESHPRSIQFAVTRFGTDTVIPGSGCTYAGP